MHAYVQESGSGYPVVSYVMDHPQRGVTPNCWWTRDVMMHFEDVVQARKGGMSCNGAYGLLQIVSNYGKFLWSSVP